MAEDRAELSPTALDESDSGAISPPWDEEPAPGINGVPVRCTLSCMLNIRELMARCSLN